MTQEELILEPGKYTVQIALESDNFHVSAPKEYALTLYNESDFFELVLRDETRGEPVADYTYDSATGAFDVSAGTARALGEYTFYGISSFGTTLATAQASILRICALALRARTAASYRLRS